MRRSAAFKTSVLFTGIAVACLFVADLHVSTRLDARFHLRRGAERA